MNRSQARIRWVLTGTILIVLGFCSNLAEGSDDAEAAIRRGIELRKKGEDEAARREFERAYSTAKTPRSAAQLGFAEQAIGDWASAEAHVVEALSAGDDPWIATNRAVIENALEAIQGHTGRIDVLGGIPGADVEVNGKMVGRLPLKESILVNSGDVVVIVRATGHRPTTKTISVAPRGRARLFFALEAIAVSQSVSLPDAVPTPEASSSSDRTLRRIGLGLMISAAPLLGAAVGSMIISNGKLDRLERGVTEQTPYDESTGNWKTFQTASVILYFAAGASAVAGVATYYLGRGRESSGVASLLPVAWREGIALCGRFR